ncbi:hypothetical protein Bpfe_023961 [Biomphalaria pfeifferi]|uniref:Uncharacterized protein n=1 Tax=Biomphalaria pfeifferi TaxID=112525 RepID=A0AAD8F164_BIOPF|nr:hypothetical protein Bpfe_023961 [Biomphalaria pfeifferi]
MATDVLERFIKKSQRNKLWAHARNKTTEKQLKGRLQHLQEEYDREYRHYIRKRNRIYRDLIDLRSLNETKQNEDVEKLVLHSSALATVTAIPKADLSPLVQDSQSIQTINSINKVPRSRSSDNLLPISTLTSTKARTDKESESHETKLRFNVTNFKAIGQQTSRSDSSLVLNQSDSALLVLGSDNKQSMAANDCIHVTFEEAERVKRLTVDLDTACRYKEGSKTGVSCLYFPCHIPRTYHTIGYRRDDLIPRTSDITNRDFDPLSDERPAHPKDSTRSSNSIIEDITTYVPSKNEIPKWSNRKSKGTVKLNQSINGPMFSPKPLDPVLEQIRTGAVEEIGETPSMTRKTVRAKIRGLKQLVVEMRFRNDKTKPPDWAVNYGTRLPTRFLFNPAFPV